MGCLTHEQLAAIALGIDSGESQRQHITQCETCKEALDELQQLTERLSAAHAAMRHSHDFSRAGLLEQLPNYATYATTARDDGAWSTVVRRLKDLTPRQRLAVGSVGISTAAIILLMFVVANLAAPLSAMERMAKAVQEVKSYSYKMFAQDTFVRKGDTEPSTVTHTNTTYWLEPKSLFYDEKLVKYEGTVPHGEGELLSHLTGIHPTGEPGMLVFHAGTGRATKSMARTYFWVPELPSMSAEDIGKESPITRLRMVREGVGEVLRELGTKAIDGKQARGYVMALKDAKLGSGFDSLEVWVDPATDLPLEFGYELEDEKITRIYRITDCRWNIEIDPKLFDTTPPKGYEDISPPSDTKAIAEIVAALKLYAELSGGHYPRVTAFDPEAIRNEMLKLVTYTGQRREDWQKLLRIEQAAVGLNKIAPVLRNTTNAGYYGDEVGPKDKEKVLLWWTVVDPLDPPESTYESSFRVFYGDLRTDVLPLAKWAQLVPADVAAFHVPEDSN
jgi:outer membrane lipoprotein-sorting protein